MHFVQIDVKMIMFKIRRYPIDQLIFSLPVKQAFCLFFFAQVEQLF